MTCYLLTLQVEIIGLVPTRLQAAVLSQFCQKTDFVFHQGAENFSFPVLIPVSSLTVRLPDLLLTQLQLGSPPQCGCVRHTPVAERQLTTDERVA